MQHEESILQRRCVAWFRLQHRDLAPLLFAVPNGGARSRVEAAIMKAEGVTAGVADLLLLVPRGGWSCLCIEMKTQKGRQTPEQKAWQEAATSKGGALYVVCRSFEEFASYVHNYLCETITKADQSAEWHAKGQTQHLTFDWK